MKWMGLMSVALAATLAVACGGDRRDNDMNRPADTPAVGTAGDAANRDVNNGARDWVRDRMIGNMAEVKLGELAAERGRHADVKAFGRMMVEDHTKANDELKQLAAKHDVQPPAEVDDEHRGKMEELQKLQGAEFDREYINTMVEGHENTLEALEDRLDKEGDDKNPRYTAKQTDDPFEMQLNQWAAKTAPVVHKHLERSRQIDQALGRRMTER